MEREWKDEWNEVKQKGWERILNASTAVATLALA
jgi:hypothetical protein